MDHIPDLADPVAQDIEEAARRVSSNAINALRDAHLLITGGTGFLGSWLVDVLIALNRHHRLNLAMTLLTRQKSALAGRRPDWFAAPEIILLEGDVTNFSCLDARFTHVVHAAADVGTVNVKPFELSEAIVAGSRHVLEIAVKAGAKRYLYFSSGAAVGQPACPHLIPENATTAPPVDDPSAYSNAKRYAEHLHLLAATEFGLELVIARGFSFVGPRMPLHKFAIGNFIRDALLGITPRLNSTGSAVRSYLYAGDSAHWLITLLALGGASCIYNVGSDRAITVGGLAARVAKLHHCPPPAISDSDHDEKSYYVPDIRRAGEELGLRATVSLDDAILKTAQWVKNSGVALSR